MKLAGEGNPKAEIPKGEGRRAQVGVSRVLFGRSMAPSSTSQTRWPSEPANFSRLAFNFNTVNLRLSGFGFPMTSPSLTIDSHPVPFVPGESVLDAARRLGINIPTLCYLEKCGPL